MSKIFDFHFHLLFKHILTKGFDLKDNIVLHGVAGDIDRLVGGCFESQASPSQVKNSDLRFGVAAIIALEHAFANRMLDVFGIDLARKFPLNEQLINDTRDGKTSYIDEFIKQLNFHLDNEDRLKNEFNLYFIKREQWQGKTPAELIAELENSGKKYIAFSIEGGHNLSEVPIHGDQVCTSPELKKVAGQI
jgi:hypothetical protein